MTMNTPIFELVGPTHNVKLFGIRLLGVDAQNGRKLIFTLVFFAILYGISRLLRLLARGTSSKSSKTVSFWTRQGISLITFLLGLIGFVSIWFDDPTRLATGIGLLGAGLAFALQKVVTSFAGYFVILRGKTFNVGDRITMGGVRGDVIALNFIQTVIMEMGEPPSVQGADPGQWVQSRQYSGRIVTVTNAKIFDEPVYNYTRDFPFIWEEIHIPISYKDDRYQAEKILLAAAEKETVQLAELAEETLTVLEQRFSIKKLQLRPQVYMRLTDNWVELTVRFLCKEHDIRGLKDRMSREIIDNLDKAKIGIASGTYEIVGLPPIRVEMQS
ncbi:mechanosensitive ion channel family protein [Terriglobus sp.]|uniref:mechanosensitive ion channel family protein n=1 Tax=Terriglobus sp. TaxID=1889013 RepID=UPI003AFFA682